MDGPDQVVPQECVSFFDRDGDGDIDLRDYAAWKPDLKGKEKLANVLNVGISPTVLVDDTSRITVGQQVIVTRNGVHGAQVQTVESISAGTIVVACPVLTTETSEVWSYDPNTANTLYVTCMIPGNNQ